MIKYINGPECEGPEMVQKMFALADKKFDADLMHAIDARTLARNKSPYSLHSAAVDAETGEMLSYFIWSITDTRFRDGLVSGKLKEEDLHLYDGSHPAVLFFNTFIVTNRHHAPYVVRHVTRELRTLIEKDFELKICGGLAIGGLRFTEKWLKKFDFYEIGRYQNQYPILWAARQESAMLNSLLNVN